MNENKQQHFLSLYEPNHQGLLRYCESILRDPQDAKDLVSETVLVAYEQFDKLRNEASFKYFLFGIARNLLRRLQRRKKFWGIFNVQTAEQLPASDNAEWSTEVHLLYKALDKLPVAQKEALILFEISGYNLQEISEIQQTSLSNVKIRLMRGREKLLKILSPEIRYVYESRLG